MSEAAAIMSQVRYPLGPDDRVHLLCWLTCGFLGAYYLEGAWPDPSFQVRAAHRWLERHQRAADWIETAKLSVKAQALASRFSSMLDTDAGRRVIEQIIEGDELDYDSVLVQRIHSACVIELTERRRPSR
ncbi:hypothetical protein AWB72_02819 [Caballeronia concitans]|uniref:Uncharacterized protein n=2 Tax=Caballeronia concitans TaxID=1777133 RepID=A0A658QXV0_9BURK|nr:hypothetical protein BurMR1_5109 [Burkholderia sp. MR1]SAL31757.1 hypothetical protein AWB72_02819 [Caballeronia concitans]